MRILGLDLGARRMGWARSDEAGIFAHGVGFIESKTEAENVVSVLGLIKEHKAEAVVVGHPLNMNGSGGKQAEAAKRFAERLGQAAGLPVILWDERMSTQEAERYLREGDMSRRKRKGRVDALAAQIILQSYMDAQKQRGS